MKRLLAVCVLVLLSGTPVFAAAEDVDEFAIDDMELELDELSLDDTAIEEIPEEAVVELSTEEAEEKADPGAGAAAVVRTLYIAAIIVIVGSMLLHNLLLWLSFVRRKMRASREAGASRFSALEMTFHLTLIISFAGLAFTGFALPYSDMVIFKWVYTAGLADERALAHRIFAVLMLGGLATFLVYSVASRAGRRTWWRRMWPGVGDLKDLWATISYHLGRRTDKPVYPHFSYVEKAEYWALLWGTAIMGVTGLMLWFREYLPSASAAWLESVAGAVHFYEAVLSLLAIVTWHFFFVLVHPEKALQIPLPED